METQCFFLTDDGEAPYLSSFTTNSCNQPLFSLFPSLANISPMKGSWLRATTVSTYVIKLCLWAESRMLRACLVIGLIGIFTIFCDGAAIGIDEVEKVIWVLTLPDMMFYLVVSIKSLLGRLSVGGLARWLVGRSVCLS